MMYLHNFCFSGFHAQKKSFIGLTEVWLVYVNWTIEVVAKTL